MHGDGNSFERERKRAVAMETPIHPFLPLLQKTVSGALEWAPELGLVLQSLATGSHSVHDGPALCLFVNNLRAKSCLPLLSTVVLHGLTTYFDEFIAQATSEGFFKKVLPFMADLAFRFPLLLNDHFDYSKNHLAPVHLRVLKPQEPGLVYMNQELAAAILACAFFSLYPTQGRREASLPNFNFDLLFERISSDATQQQQKVHCIVHYFTKLSQDMPQGVISFERKLLPMQPEDSFNENYWRKSSSSFCSIQVINDGLIEDQSSNALEVDFANRFLGGGVLRKGCVQEEIRFVICPELIAGMLFMPAMEANEAIEIRGVERFSHYTGYSSSFRFAGDYTDTKPKDLQGRRDTHIVAIDALRHPGQRQYEEALILRETNKAFCGFQHQLELNFTGRPSQVLTDLRESPFVDLQDHKQREKGATTNMIRGDETEALAKQLDKTHIISDVPYDAVQTSTSGCTTGIATGNWGCGAYGGDVELKTLIQWIAASQAGRPFLLYFTFGSPHGQRLQEVSDLIINERWLVGDVWKLLVEYGQKKFKRMKTTGLFEWLLPRLSKRST